MRSSLTSASYTSYTIEYGRFVSIIEPDLEFKKLKLTLAKNEYPDHIINKEMDKFIKNRTIREQQTQASEQLIEQQQLVKKQKRFIVLPYINHKVDAYLILKNIRRSKHTYRNT